MKITISRRSFDPTIFVAPSAAVFGDVTIGKHSSIWFNTVIRGDMAPVRIGENCNIQDNSVIHVDFENPTILGDNVSVGHGAIIHGAEVGNNCVIGVGARVLNASRVGEYCIIGAGCVITEESIIPPSSVVVGIPGKIVKTVDSHLRQIIELTRDNYLRLKEVYMTVQSD